ncbi:hypothetical protein GJ496_009810, partial [Pomphorhynchus laevis]
CIQFNCAVERRRQKNLIRILRIVLTRNNTTMSSLNNCSVNCKRARIFPD